MKRPVLHAICIALLIILYSYTALSKFLDESEFVRKMSQAPVWHMKDLAPVLGWLIPLSESVIVAGLLTQKFQRTALYASLTLLCAFELYITLMLLSGLKLPCACGGVISRLGWKGHLVFNAFFILCSILPLRDRPTIQELSRA